MCLDHGQDGRPAGTFFIPLPSANTSCPAQIETPPPHFHRSLRNTLPSDATPRRAAISRCDYERGRREGTSVNVIGRRVRPALFCLQGNNGSYREKPAPPSPALALGRTKQPTWAG
jgi:hypothetical protein